MDLTTASTTEWVLIIVLGVVLIASIAAFLLLRKRRTERLRTQFGGAEYERAVEKGGNRRQAEAALKERAQRVEGLHVQPLAAGDRARFIESWRGVQARFVDGPAGAVTEADQLLGDVMSTRGYPVSNFRTTGGGYLRGSSTGSRELSNGSRNRAAADTRTGQHGRPAPGNGSLPDAFRGTDWRARYASDKGCIIKLPRPLVHIGLRSTTICNGLTKCL